MFGRRHKRYRRLAFVSALLPQTVGAKSRLNNAIPSLQPHYRAFLTTTNRSVPVLRVGTLVLLDLANWISPFASERQVPTFHTKARCRLAPSICRTPLGQDQVIPRTCPRVSAFPRFRRRLTTFDISSTVRLRSPFCITPAGIMSRLFPQRSPPSLFTIAACGGLKPAPDRRLRGARPHLSYSIAPPLLLVRSWHTAEDCRSQYPHEASTLFAEINLERLTSA